MPTTNLLDQVVFKKNNVPTTYYLSGSVVKGYFNETDGKFYEEDTYTTEITGHNGLFYITLDTNYIYRYDETDTEFVQIGGSGDANAIIYVNSLPSSDIKNVIYGITSSTSYSDTIADGFLDNNELFERTDGSNNEYVYTAKEGITLEASTDGTEYLSFDSLAYDGTSDWTLTFDDGTDATLADGDTFYFKHIEDLFYAGNEEKQTLTIFGSGGGSSSGSMYFPGEGIRISNHIVSLLPATPSTLGGIKPDNTTVEVTASGTLKGNYQGGYGIKINGNEISAKTFIGTTADWNLLSPAQQAEFDTVSLTDDGTTINNTPGHTVQNDTTTFPQRTNLKFADATITDDSVNDATIVSHTPYTAGDKIDITNHVVSCDETVKGTFIGTTAEWNILSAADKAKYDVVNLTDDQSSVTTVVDTVAEGNMNAVTSNAVAAISKRVNANTQPDNWIDISSYTTTTTSFDADKLYTCPCDGYFLLGVAQTTNLYDCILSGYIYGPNDVPYSGTPRSVYKTLGMFTVASDNTGFMNNSLFVKKGMRIGYRIQKGTAIAYNRYFCPINE